MKEELKIVRVRAPEVSKKLAKEVVAFIHEVRKLALKKTPGLSETIEWARALTMLNASNLKRKDVERTLGVFVKYESDAQRVRGDLTPLLKKTGLQIEKWLN